MKLLRDIAGYLSVFYKYSGKWLFVIFSLILVGGFLEGLSVSLLLPLINVGMGAESQDPISQFVYDYFDVFGINPTLSSMLIVLVCVVLLKAVLTFAHKSIAAYGKTQIRRDIQTRLLYLFGGMSYQHYTEATSGRLNNLVINEVPRFLQGFIEFTRMPVSIAYIFVYAFMAAILRVDVMIVLFGLTIFVAFLLKTFVAKTRRLSLQVTDAAGRLQEMLVEYLMNLTYLKATSSSSTIAKGIQKAVNNYANKEFRVVILSYVLSVAKEPIAAIFLAALIFYQVEMEGSVISEVLVLGLLLHRMVGQTLQVQAEWQRFNSTIGGVRAVPEAIDSLTNEQEVQGNIVVDNLQHPISFKGVSTAHGDVEVLSDINLTILPNETIGVVGPSGAGKTTFFYLLTGLMRPTKGDIFVGQNKFSEVNMHAFRSHIGYVTQAPVILNDTFANNIALGVSDTSTPECVQQIKASASMANCNDLGLELDTQLGEQGIRLSGGQRQRVAIARELFKNPEFLIFDEATSALDSHSEEVIQQSIDALKGQRTVLLIAHRLSTVRNCDRIFVFDKGRVVDTGTFDELYAKDGSLFREMCEKQKMTA